MDPSPTNTLIRDLNSRGIDRISLVIRHSARYYDKDVKMEPFMCLTPEGRNMAMNMGASLPENFSLEFFSSYIGRCIETAYLIDKGFVGKAGGLTRDNRIAEPMSPFYVRNIKKTLEILMEQDVFTFIRSWMDGDLGDDILMNAREAAWDMIRFMTGGLDETAHNTLQVCVTHDWNLYLLKEYGLGLAHEDAGKVDYLEGVAVYSQNGKFYMANHQTEPIPLDLDL
jgi:hypothetical protein